MVRQLYAGTVCGFMAALPFVMISSFYPVYLEDNGLAKEMIGTLSAGYYIGFILLGMVVGNLLERIGFRNLATLSLLLMGCSMVIVSILPTSFALFPAMLLLGVSTAGPNLIYQTIGSMYSKPEDLGATIALSSYGFPLSFFVVPLIIGLIANQLGMRLVLIMVAIFVLLGGIVIRHYFNYLEVSDSRHN